MCAHGIVFSKAAQVLSDSAPPDTELVNLISPNQLSQQQPFAVTLVDMQIGLNHVYP